jgi:hypothetical protein
MMTMVQDGSNNDHAKSTATTEILVAVAVAEVHGVGDVVVVVVEAEVEFVPWVQVGLPHPCDECFVLVVSGTHDARTPHLKVLAVHLACIALDRLVCSEFTTSTQRLMLASSQTVLCI